MAWTDERIDTLRKMWEDGQTASQIAEALGQVSRNAVIGKAHRLGLQSRPSPVKPNEVAVEVAAKPVVEPAAPKPVVAALPEVSKPVEVVAAPPADPVFEADEDEDAEISDAPVAAPAPVAPPQPILRSVGPGGFLRQSPGEQQAPITPAPPRRLVPAKPSADMAGKTTLLDLSDRICKWPLGHPGEPDFHFCGDKVNPGFPYCVAHCGHAYQAQLPRRDRRPPPPLPFGGPRVR
ncbi:GcrA cell cycle regulator [Sphingomonas populi]|uniref:GcrA cell cycle regulator n=1 Tax=Sphingomonas populi TaxID=2484750 RepID=A0A4Q6Y3T7_9SPHN|nr:GcrA family cell cycle regulator [Sphingomonas populi]RZF64484.1 GcrA cell cycle regulator [Sphingomonas populi]